MIGKVESKLLCLSAKFKNILCIPLWDSSIRHRWNVLFTLNPHTIKGGHTYKETNTGSLMSS